MYRDMLGGSVQDICEPFFLKENLCKDYRIYILDALAIVEKANPNSAVRIDKMIADINKHRNVDKKINGDTFTTTYGAERAKARAAKQKKPEAAKKTEVKKVNKTISM